MLDDFAAPKKMMMKSMRKAAPESKKKESNRNETLINCLNYIMRYLYRILSI
jgi:hypothetical protein